MKNPDLLRTMFEQVIALAPEQREQWQRLERAWRDQIGGERFYVAKKPPEARTKAAPAATLVTAAAVLAKGVVAAIDAGGLRVQRAAALDLLDNAGRTIGAELRRRR